MKLFRITQKIFVHFRNDIYRFFCTFRRALKICFALLRMVSIHFYAPFRIALKVLCTFDIDIFGFLWSFKDRF